MTADCTITTDRQCSPCVAPTFSDDGLTCKQCDGEGKYNDEDGAAFCKTVKAGYKPTEDRKGEEQCPAGTYTDDGVACKTCEAEGQYSDEDGAAYCKTAKAGYKPTLDHKAEERCPAGKYSTGGTNACSDCGDGETSGAGAAGCSTCASCATGRYMIKACTPTSETECGDCLAGTVSTGGTVKQCTSCTADGEYSDTDLAR